MAKHTIGVRLYTGKQPEGIDGLKNSHAAAIENTAASLFCNAEKFSPEREVDDFRKPVFTAKQMLRQRQTGMRGHTGRSGVDQPVRVCHDGFQTAARDCLAIAESSA